MVQRFIQTLSLMSVLAVGAIQASGQSYIPHGQTAAPSSAAAPAEAMAIPTERPNLMVDPDRKLQQGDQLSFSIEEDHDPAVPLVVSAGGDVRIEPLCAVHVAGLTVVDASGAIKRRLEADYYYKATIRLALERVNQNFSLGNVYLSGEIQRVGGLPIYADRPLTLSQAVTNAGGFGRFANGRKVKVTRAGKNGATETIVRDVKAILEGGHKELDIPLQDGDQIFIPRATFNF